MQRVVIIPEEEFNTLIRQLEHLTKRVERLEKGLTEYVGTAEACRLTGLHRDTLYDLRKAGKVEYKYEGTKVLYLRTSLEEHNESNTPRRGKARKQNHLSIQQ